MENSSKDGGLIDISLVHSTGQLYTFSHLSGGFVSLVKLKKHLRSMCWRRGKTNGDVKVLACLKFLTTK